MVTKNPKPTVASQTVCLLLPQSWGRGPSVKLPSLWCPGISAYFHPMDVRIKVSFHNHHDQKQHKENHVLALTYLYLGGTHSISIHISLIKANLMPNVNERKKRDPSIWCLPAIKQQQNNSWMVYRIYFLLFMMNTEENH